MGAYASTTSFRYLLANYLSNNDNVNDVVGDEILSTAINRAESTVNAVLSVRYSLPFSVTPPEVKRITEDLASYYVLKASGWKSDNFKNPYVEEYKLATKDLEDISKGRRALSYTDGSIIPVKASKFIKVSTAGHSPIFNLDDEGSWGVDPDLLDDIAADRD